MRFHFISVQVVSPWVEQPAAGFKDAAGRRESCETLPQRAAARRWQEDDGRAAAEVT